MANINKISLPNGEVFDIEDAVARGKSVMVVTITGEEDSQTEEVTYSADKTYAEISAHIADGGIAYCAMDGTFIPLVMGPRDGNPFINFGYHDIYTNRVYGIGITISYTDDVNVVDFQDNISVSFLSDTTISSPANGQVLTYNNTSSKWENANLPSIPTASTSLPIADGTAAVGTSTNYARADHVHPVSSLSALSDTTITNPADGQILKYDAATGKWVNSVSDAGFDVQIVQTLPTTNIDTHTIYFVLASATVGAGTVGTATVGGSDDVYDEYMYINNAWEKIGSTRLDLSDYAKKTDIVEPVQSNWTEEDTTSLAHVLNRPAIRAGEGSNSIVEGQIEDDSGATTYTIYITGAAGATTFAYTTEDTLPSSTILTSSYCYAFYENGGSAYYQYHRIVNVDTTNHTITFDFSLNSINDSTFSNEPITILYKYGNAAIGNYSRSEGARTLAVSSYSHSENLGTTASGIGSHAEGSTTVASGAYSHAEGIRTKASGMYSHAGGGYTEASGTYSCATGRNTIAQRGYNHVFGEYNLPDTGGTGVGTKGNYIEIVGNGTADATRSNARTLDWSGNEVLAGKLTVGTGPVNNMDVATKQYVDTAVSGGGSSDVMIVTITDSGSVDQTGDAIYTSSEYYEDVMSAVNNGKVVYAKYDGGIYYYNGQAFVKMGSTNESDTFVWNLETSITDLTLARYENYGIYKYVNVYEWDNALYSSSAPSDIYDLYDNGCDAILCTLQSSSVATDAPGIYHLIYANSGGPVKFTNGVYTITITNTFVETEDAYQCTIEKNTALVYVNISGSQYEGYSISQNYSDIQTAIEEQCDICAVYENERYSLTYADSSSMIFSRPYAIGIETFTWSYNGSVNRLLTEILETNITNPQNGQILTYNSTNYEWVNSAIPAQNASISIANNVITLTNASGQTSSITLPVYSGAVSGGAS